MAIRLLLPTLLLLLVGLVYDVARADEPPAAGQAPGAATAEEVPSQEELDKRFEETMSGVEMIGSFTVAGAPADQPLSEDKYTINKVKKLDNGLWLFDATIQYGGNNTRIPISLPVKWAGDTPVITVNNVLVPGMGNFNARVLIYKDQYAGTWSGGDHGGIMFGRIAKIGAEEKQADEKVSRQTPADPAAVK